MNKIINIIILIVVMIVIVSIGTITGYEGVQLKKLVYGGTIYHNIELDNEEYILTAGGIGSIIGVLGISTYNFIKDRIEKKVVKKA